jgi:hypothetical protein
VILSTLFISEYIPSQWKALPILVWVLASFAVFFILLAHEHYTLDVVLAFYITHQLFYFYHYHASTSLEHKKTKEYMKWRSVVFPLFSYLEDTSDGLLENEYEWPWEMCMCLCCTRKSAKDISRSLPRRPTAITLASVPEINRTLIEDDAAKSSFLKKPKNQ